MEYSFIVIIPKFPLIWNARAFYGLYPWVKWIYEEIIEFEHVIVNNSMKL